MTRATSTLLGTGILCVALASSLLSAQRPTPARSTAAQAPQTASPKPAQPPQTPAGTPATRPTPAASHAALADDQNALIKRYCIGCHNEKRKDNSGGLALENFDIAKVADHAATGERMILKLQAGMMPPPGL